MAGDVFYKDGLRFSCRRCSYCCGSSPGFVYLSADDLSRLCAFLGTDAASFVDGYCRWADYYGGTTVLALREKGNYDCILWDGGCTAYEARPVQCQAWPFWTWMVADRETWEDCARTCPGMNSGELWDAAAITGWSHRYALNKPLLREEAERLMGNG